MANMDKINYGFDLKTEFGFFGHQYESGYRMIGDVLLRIKDHTANYSYFAQDLEENDLIKKIVSVNYTCETCKNATAMRVEELRASFPEIEVVEIEFNYESTSIEEAASIIKKAING